MRGDHTVLVVEDDANCREMYRNWLGEDHDLRMARDGHDAMLELDESVGVVLLDRRMAGPSGEQVANAIRDRFPECPIVMVTAVSPEPGVASMPIDEYLTKPVTGDELRTVIDQMTARQTFTEEMQSFYALAAKKATLEAELDPEALLLDDQYHALCERLREARERVERALDGTGMDWEETFQTCTAGERTDPRTEVA